MIEEIKSLLDLFESEVIDKESNRLVWEYCHDKEKWYKADDLFSFIRGMTVQAEKTGNNEREAQYLFEEVIAKTLYNIKVPPDLFDTDSPYWIIKNAFYLAKVLNIPANKVVEIIS